MATNEPVMMPEQFQASPQTPQQAPETVAAPDPVNGLTLDQVYQAYGVNPQAEVGTDDYFLAQTVNNLYNTGRIAPAAQGDNAFRNRPQTQRGNSDQVLRVMPEGLSPEAQQMWLKDSRITGFDNRTGQAVQNGRDEFSLVNQLKSMFGVGPRHASGGLDTRFNTTQRDSTDAEFRRAYQTTKDDLMNGDANRQLQVGNYQDNELSNQLHLRRQGELLSRLANVSTPEELKALRNEYRDTEKASNYKSRIGAMTPREAAAEDYLYGQDAGARYQRFIESGGGFDENGNPFMPSSGIQSSGSTTTIRGGSPNQSVPNQLVADYRGMNGERLVQSRVNDYEDDINRQKFKRDEEARKRSEKESNKLCRNPDGSIDIICAIQQGFKIG